MCIRDSKKKNEQTKAAYANNPEVKERKKRRAKEHYQKRKLAYELLKATNPDLVASLTQLTPLNQLTPLTLLAPLTAT